MSGCDWIYDGNTKNYTELKIYICQTPDSSGFTAKIMDAIKDKLKGVNGFWSDKQRSEFYKKFPQH